MVYLDYLKIWYVVRSVTLITAAVAVGTTAEAADSQNANNNVSSLSAVYASMQPVFQAAPTLPRRRPDPSLAYALEDVTIALPSSRPPLEVILPTSTLTLSEMIKSQTGIDTDGESTYKLQSGEGIGAILRRASYDTNDIVEAIDAASKKASLRRLPIGMEFTIAKHGFRFSVEPGLDIYIIKHPEDGWTSLNAVRPIVNYVTFIQGAIDDSIYQAAIAAGIAEPAFNEYVRVMGFSVDFQREVRRGDRFEMLYEVSRDGLSNDVIKVKLQYAGLELSGDQLGFFRYDEAESTVGWYDENGNSAARTLIRTPISGARLSSSFGSRKHPVSGYNAMHKGVDFAAPQGTPIIAAGSGVVKEAGWKGGYGRYIRIRHNSTFETAYAHMSRIASHISAGSRIKQGEVIGFVGSTGRSTGAHLHYEILVNKRQVNPMTVRLPTGQRIEIHHLERFKKRVEMVDAEVLARGTQRFASALVIPTLPRK
jgi:murein DD-endopeptidase MepM/ murein hydrolase activator NlpD